MVHICSAEASSGSLPLPHHALTHSRVIRVTGAIEERAAIQRRKMTMGLLALLDTLLDVAAATSPADDATSFGADYGSCLHNASASRSYVHSFTRLLVYTSLFEKSVVINGERVSSVIAVIRHSTQRAPMSFERARCLIGARLLQRRWQHIDRWGTA